MRNVYLSLVIGLVGLLVAMAVLIWGGHLVSSAQVAASDLLMVHANGPRAAARPGRSDIVLVLFDQKSAESLGYVHSYTKDLELYSKLMGAGAKVVFDTRMIAVGNTEAFAEVRTLLEGMQAIESSGRLMRDVWLTSSLQGEFGQTFQKMMVQNIINSHPHEIPSVGSRLYPLAHFNSAGVSETAPLVIGREVWGLPRATAYEVGEELRRSGVMSTWHRYAPEVVPKTDVQRSEYAVGQHKIVWHPFKPATVLVPSAGFWVSYEPSMSDYQRLSYLDVLNRPELGELKDKIVIVGFASEIDPTSDTYTVPNVLGKACAAEVLACATQTLLDERHMHEVPLAVGLTVAAALIFAVSLLTGMAKPIQALAGATAMLVLYFILATLAYKAGWYADFLVAPSIALLAGIPSGAASAWLNLRARQRVVDLFGRYVPRAIVSQLIQRSELESLTLGGVKREVTVMFADIRGFTNFSQHLAPEDVVRELNSLLEVMVACTFESDGTLDKFIGDAILVLFNAPLDQPDHTARAVRTAVNIQQRLVGHASGLRVGIGLHRGSAVIGNIGTPQRMEYTAIGSTVNIASRLCDLAEPGDVVVSQSVAEALSGSFDLEPLGSVQVKGITESLSIARVRLQGQAKRAAPGHDETQPAKASESDQT